MKYLIRSIKYFFYFSILCSLIIGALIAIGAVEGNIDAIFDEGYRSIVKIGIFFIIVAAVYPKLGFITRQIPSDKNWEQARESIVKYMYEHNYTIGSESPQVVTFRVRGALARLSKMYEDRITLTRTAEGWALEGLRKDAFRLANGIEHVLNAPVQES